MHSEKFPGVLQQGEQTQVEQVTSNSSNVVQPICLPVSIRVPLLQVTVIPWYSQTFKADHQVCEMYLIVILIYSSLSGNELEWLLDVYEPFVFHSLCNTSLFFNLILFFLSISLWTFYCFLIET